MTLDEAISRALALHEAGQQDQAEALYRLILEEVPGLGAAHAGLADVLIGRDRPEEAAAHYRRAIELDHDSIPLRYNLGIALTRLGQTGEALEAIDAIIRVQPDFADVHNIRGNLLHRLGRPEEAEAAYRRNLALHPDSAGTLSNLGNILGRRGETAEAAQCYRRAIALQPDMVAPHYNLALLLDRMGESDQALACFDRLLERWPDYPEGLLSRGHLLNGLGRLDDAIASYRRAIAARPDYAEAYCAIANIHAEAGNYDIALPIYRRAQELKPDLAAAHHGVGLCLKGKGLLDEAQACLETALVLDPGFTASLGALASLHTSLGRYHEAARCYRRALEIDPSRVDNHRYLLLTQVYDPALTPEERFAEHRRFEAMHARPHYPAKVAFANPRDPGRRLRIGYLSSDFGNHPVGHNLLPVLENHDRRAIELFLYPSMRSDDPLTGRFITLADHWRPVTGLSDRDAAELIRADGIDILVILAGRFDANRPLVAAYRPAPVQVSYWDAATSGLEVMDGFITDRVHTPRHGAELFTERPLRLPGLYIHHPLTDVPPTAPPPILVNGYPTFGSFNNPAKLSDPVLALWARVMMALPEARLVLKYREFFHHPAVARRVAETMAAHGVALDRIEMLGAWESRESHLSLYDRIDIALDPFPFNGATTTFEALSMGVPVVSLLGTTFMARWSASMLTTLKLDRRLVAGSEDGYVDICRDLAADPGYLAELRTGLREKIAASPLCDGRRKTRQIERMYRALWRRWCRATTQEPGR